MRQFCLIAAAAIALWAAGPGRAGYVYVVQPSAPAAWPGDAVSVDVFLRETGTSTLHDVGLIAAGVTVAFGDAPHPLALTGVTFNPAFDGQTASLSGSGSVILAEDVGIVSPPVTAAGAGPDDQVLLATLTFAVPGGAQDGEVTHLTATTPDPALGFSTILNDFTFLDGAVSDGPATVTVRAQGPSNLVPAPPAAVLAGMGGLTGLAYRLRLRRRPA